MKLVRELLDKTIERFSLFRLFPNPPPCYFSPEISVCPKCGGRLKVKKPRTRQVFTLHIGGFKLNETYLECAGCDEHPVYRSETLKELFPERGRFGYDIIVYIGMNLFLRHHTSGEIMGELKLKKVEISEREVDYLARKFIVYLSIAHSQAATRLKKAMSLNGGYILHIDATCDKGSPLLLSGLDSITGIVLWNIKVPSEKAEHVVPFLRKIKTEFGCPLLVVADMSRGFENAILEVFGKNMDILICHFHFLRDLGKDLFGKEYDLIRQRLTKHGISTKLRRRASSLQSVVGGNLSMLDKFGLPENCPGKLSEEERRLMPAVIAYTLIQWTFNGKTAGGGYGFPFDRTHLEFALRLKEMFSMTEKLTGIFSLNQFKYNKPLHKTAGDIRKVIDDGILWTAVKKIKEKTEVFDRLRVAMRIAPKSARKGLNDNGGDEPIGKIKDRVKKFRKSVVNNPLINNNGDYQKMIAQIDKYWNKLFADPITVDTPNGRISVQPQRTNNISEQFFRDIRHDYRRRTGNGSMAKTLKAMNANMPLVKNLGKKQYVDILLDNKKSLEELFSTIKPEEVNKEIKAASVINEKVPAKVKQIIKCENFSKIMMESLKKMLPSK